MRKRKIYLAQRISINADPTMILPIKSFMSPQKIKKLYTQKTINKEKYIHNGHWILRPLRSKNSFEENNIPSTITPYDIWDMVQQKINTSDAMLAIINAKAYGTIVEIGHASGTGKLAVYVLPEKSMGMEEIEDLWLIFQAGLQTKQNWKEEDIKNIETFKEYDIYSR